MSQIEVAHSLPTGAAVATVAAEGYDLGPGRAWAISRGVTDHYAVEAGGRRYALIVFGRLLPAIIAYGRWAVGRCERFRSTSSVGDYRCKYGSSEQELGTRCRSTAWIG